MRTRFAAMIISTLALVALSVTPAGADGWWLQYSDTSTRLCLDADYHANTAYWSLTEATCKTPVGSGAADQVFQLVPQSNGTAWILSGVSGTMCVGVASGSPNDGAAVFLTNCPAPGTNWFAQEWQVSTVSENPNGSANVLFRNATSQKCITGTGSGVALFQQACDSANPHQVWRQHLKESGCTRCVAAARRS
ncbi:RICIN domain-containing protein [Amycolatopsis kentuckyensis]|uniref:RICIN domain-containing protein n=1 Tax=Amycolatopsis kentuckyensis TaxID=218823 RepID=UPI000A39E1DE|nr:ricin-type beta-trefoil lectin domain protein [Amycolatopsis kentuckyensis]